MRLMKVSEAIKYIEQHGFIADEVKDMAIKSLEMQIPKKPIYIDFDDNGNDEIIPYKAVCPTCGHEFEFGTWNDEENHHCKCGQNIYWKGMSNE